MCTIFIRAASECSFSQYYSSPRPLSVSPYKIFNSSLICLIFPYVEFVLISSISFIIQNIFCKTYYMLYSCRQRDYLRYNMFVISIVIDLPNVISFLDGFGKFKARWISMYQFQNLYYTKYLVEKLFDTLQLQIAWIFDIYHFYPGYNIWSVRFPNVWFIINYPKYIAYISLDIVLLQAVNISKI